MAKFSISEIKQEIDNFNEMYHKYLNLKRTLEHEERRYHMVGRDYVAAGPYHADHNYFEACMDSINDVRSQKKQVGKKCIRDLDTLSSHLLSFKKDDFNDDQHLVHLYEVVTSIRNINRINLFFFMMGIISLMYGLMTLSLLFIAGGIVVIFFTFYNTPLIPSFKVTKMEYVGTQCFSDRR